MSDNVECAIQVLQRRRPRPSQANIIQARDPRFDRVVIATSPNYSHWLVFKRL